MPILDHLEPRAVFSCFEQLCAIPHGSGNTKAISDYLVRFAAEHQLRCIQDAHNNVIIFAPGTPGYESAAPVILQGHMDMVCETAPDCTKDMAREGLDLFVDGDTIGARGTTLGGDDGIAVAMALAILAAGDIPHPPLEVVITVDEETGMLGAAALDASVLKGRTMLNLDSEDEGVLTVSCAGGNVSVCTLPVTRAPFSGTALTVTVGGLLGGHSGAEIDKGRGNANLLMGRVLYAVGARTPLRLVSVAGGLKDNAIPSQAEAEIAVPAGTELTDIAAAYTQFIHGLVNVDFKVKSDAFPALFRYTFPEVITTERGIRSEEGDFDRQLRCALVSGMRLDAELYVCRADLGASPKYAAEVKRYTDIQTEYAEFLLRGRFTVLDTSALPYYIKRGEYYSEDGAKVLRILYNAAQETTETVCGVALRPDEMRFDIFDRDKYEKELNQQ